VSAGPHRLSVALLARDEERHIGAALASVVDLADELLVLLDQRTSDRSASIAASYGARVVHARWRGFPAQRNLALELCQGDWVLFLDADERITPTLAAEIRAVLEAPSSAAVGYWLPRDNQFFGRTLRGGGWSPDDQLRLLRRGHARYDEDRLVHEVALLDGPSARLHGHLLHLNIERLDEFWWKQRSYAIQEAHTLYRAGRRTRWRNFVGAPLREFRRRYFDLAGYRDGALGLFLCTALAYFELVKFTHLKGLEVLSRG